MIRSPSLRTVVLCLALAPLGAQDLVTVKAVVVDQAGKPIDGVGVRVGTAESLFTQDVLRAPISWSDAKGRLRFQIPRVRYMGNAVEARYVLLAREGYATIRAGLIADNYNPYSGVAQNSDAGSDLGRITLLPGGVLRGQVRGVAGEPLAGARVVAGDFLTSGYYARFSNYGFQLPVFESRAKTDAKGRFELAGVFPEGVSLRVQAPGYYDARLPFVDSRHTIDVSMERSGFVEGHVVDGEAKPVDAVLYMRYETMSGARGEITDLLRTEKDGKFKISIAARGRYAFFATAVIRPGETSRVKYSNSFTRIRHDIEVELANPAEPRKPITVEVVDKKTGKPVTTAKAVVLWQDPRYLNAAVLEGRFRANAVKADDAGKIVLHGPLSNQPPTGGVLVKAKGHAPGVQKKIEYDDEKPPALKVELEKEVAIRGVVVDPRTNKPIAHARVTVSPAGMATQAMMYRYGYYGGGVSSTVVSTDKDGHFHVGGLGPGKYEVTAKVDGRPASKLQRFTLKTGEERGGIRIEIPVGMSLSGKVFAGLDDKGGELPAKLPGGWMVRLGGTTRPGQFDRWVFSGRIPFGYYNRYGMTNGLSAAPVALGTGGEFRFEGLAAGRYRFNLMAPPIGKRGRHVLASIEPLRIRKKDLARDFDISADVPGIVRGKIEVSGTRIAMSRLFVLAVPIGSAAKRPSRVSYSPAFFRCVVDEDRTFAFRANRGRYHIYIMDGAYSTVLCHAPAPVDVEIGKTANVKFTMPLTRVRVRLRPENEGGKIVVGRLEWLARYPGDVSDTNFGRYEQGYGQIVEGQTEFFLIVPPVKLQFCVRNYPSMIDPRGGHNNTVTSGEGEVTAMMGRLETLDLKVRAPEELSNAAPPEGTGKQAGEKVNSDTGKVGR